MVHAAESDAPAVAVGPNQALVLLLGFQLVLGPPGMLKLEQQGRAQHSRDWVWRRHDGRVDVDRILGKPSTRTCLASAKNLVSRQG